MRTTLKTCFKCGLEKLITDFYAHPAMTDGHLNKCKVCAREDARLNYKKNVEYYRIYDRKRGFRAYDIQKIRARRAVRDALARGELVRGVCEIGVNCYGRIEAHHDDYTKPLNVAWLCRPCHLDLHAGS